MSLPRKISWLSTYMLHRTDVQEIASVRRSNWLYLYKCLDEQGLLNYLTPLFTSLIVGEVPLGFPVKVSDGQRDEFRQYLVAQNIYCPIHWALDHLEGFDQEYLEELILSRNILTLPIDQRLSKLHIEYMVKTISNYFRPSDSERRLII